MAASIVLAVGTGARGQAIIEGGASAALDASQHPVISGSDNTVDESALRYYASLKGTTRVEAEIRRLKHFHPTWTVPTDLYSPQATSGVHEEPLWALFSADKIDELRATINARMAADPTWHPSDDLARKLRGREVHTLVTAELKAKHWQAAIDLAEAEARYIDIKDVQLRWDVALAYKEIHRTNKAFELLYSILATSRDPVQRLVTAQKAISYLPMADAEKLISMGQSSPDGRNEFDPIASDIARARISAFLHDEPAHEVSASELEPVQAAARTSEDPNQAGLIAWYDYKRGDLREALEWFKWSLAHGGDSMIAHGLAHTLRRLGQLRETEEVAFAWRGPLINNNILFIDILEKDLTRQIPPFIEPARLARYAQVTMSSQSGEGAQALAWYAYNSCQFDTALGWFRHAVAWLPKEATIYGYALTLRRLKKNKDFFEVVNRYDGLFPTSVELIFPDGLNHPPGRCDPQPAGQRSEAVSVAAADEPHAASGLHYLGDFRNDAPPSTGRRSAADRQAGDRQSLRRSADDPASARRTPYARVPLADGQAPDDATGHMPVIKRDEFPISVRGENDLRFDGSETRAEVATSLLERSPLIPLTARRVPGVTTMPYEKYGFALLPGYTGVETASEVPASRLPPAAGTAWAAEVSSDTSQQAASRTSGIMNKSDPAQSRLP